jgi:phosphatidylglycerophosphate synthase
VLSALAFVYPSRALLVACLAAGWLSDVLDGVLARGLEVVTPWLRRYDSAVDMV